MFRNINHSSTFLASWNDLYAVMSFAFSGEKAKLMLRHFLLPEKKGIPWVKVPR
jgi:hypothetical protein